MSFKNKVIVPRQRFIIGITGKKRSGKNTLAAHWMYIINQRCKSQVATCYAFADPIRESVKSIFGWDNFFIEFHKEEIDPLFGISPRKAMQLMGTEFGRNLIHPDLWILSIQRRIERTYGHQIFLIPDVRFNNEAKWIKDQGGVIVKVERPNIDNLDSHVSEQGIDESFIDYTIINDSDIQAFKDKSDPVLEEILESHGILHELGIMPFFIRVDT